MVDDNNTVFYLLYDDDEDDDNNGRGSVECTNSDPNQSNCPLFPFYVLLGVPFCRPSETEDG